MAEPQVWENGGNVVSLERKRREMAERLEQDRVDGALSGEDTITVLCCPCGCEALTTFTDGDYMYTECMECGEPMVFALLAFLAGDY